MTNKGNAGYQICEMQLTLLERVIALNAVIYYRDGRSKINNLQFYLKLQNKSRINKM